MKNFVICVIWGCFWALGMVTVLVVIARVVLP